MRSSSRCSLTLVLLSTLAWSALASPMRPVDGGASTPGDRPTAEQLLDATAETTIRRLPNCEVTIRTRVAEWKASGASAHHQGLGQVAEHRRYPPHMPRLGVRQQPQFCPAFFQLVGDPHQAFAALRQEHRQDAHAQVQ